MHEGQIIAFTIPDKKLKENSEGIFPNIHPIPTPLFSR